MHKLYTAANLQEAHLIAGMLTAAGIATHVFNQHLQGGLGEIPFGEAYPEVWLDDDADVARAQRIVADYERPPRGDRPGVVCSQCGEVNPGDFEICWRCGKSIM